MVFLPIVLGVFIIPEVIIMVVIEIIRVRIASGSDIAEIRFHIQILHIICAVFHGSVTTFSW